MSERTEIFDKVYKAAEHYQRTGHERDSDSVRKILVEDVRVSSEGMVYAIGIDNRYNLKQYASQYPQHVRAYRIDRMVC